MSDPRVEVDLTAPRLTPRAARLLLRILRQAAENVAASSPPPNAVEQAA